MKINFENFSVRESELIIKISHLSSILNDTNSKRHINLGLLNRFYMLKIARNKIIQIIEAQNDTPLDFGNASWLKLLLNSYYINLRGALDNLAWFLNYEFKLQENIIEEAGKGSSFSFTDLFGKEFSVKLKNIKQTLTEELEKHKDWYIDLKNFRDPAAHRIPLAFVQGVITENESEKLETITSERALIYNEFSKGNFSKLDEAIKIEKDYSKLGQFQPIIITAEASKYECYYASKQIDKDHNEFICVTEVIIDNI